MIPATKIFGKYYIMMNHCKISIMFEEKWKRDKHDATTNNNGKKKVEIDCQGYDDVKVQRLQSRHNNDFSFSLSFAIAILAWMGQMRKKIRIPYTILWCTHNYIIIYEAYLHQLVVCVNNNNRRKSKIFISLPTTLAKMSGHRAS